MKKFVILLAAVTFFAGTRPAFAGGEGSAKPKEDSLFQIMSDTMKPGEVKEKNKYRKVEKIYLFQSLSDGIKEGSKKAKQESLRTTK